jgi:hypothetical protein
MRATRRKQSMAGGRQSASPLDAPASCLTQKVMVTHLLHAHSASGRSAQSRPRQHTWYAPGQKSHSTRGEKVAWYVSPHTPHLLEFAANCALLTFACAGLGAPGATGPACDIGAAAAAPPLLLPAAPALNCCHRGVATAGSKCCISFVRTSATLMGWAEFCKTRAEAEAEQQPEEEEGCWRGQGESHKRLAGKMEPPANHHPL